MATRRPRLVIKPNIRPATAKANTSAAKPKPTVNTDSPSLLKEKHTCLHHEDTTEPGENVEDAKSRQNLANNERADDMGQVSISLNTDVDDVISSKETSSNSHSLGDVISSKEEVTVQDESVAQSNDTAVHAPANSTVPAALSRSKGKTLKTPAPDVSDEASRGTDFVDSNEELQDDIAKEQENEAPPSETDASCMSEALSLEPEDERRGEVDDEAQKKQRRRRSKKQRTEPLPSREKSPDRQKMKMSDLLSWNPQQNFLPKKNKKKTQPKDESQPASPALCNVILEDKESSNHSASLPAPQVMIGPDGSVVLNTESLLIHTPKDDSVAKEIIEEDDDDKYLNTNTYRKYKKTKLWTEKETEKFFMGLSMCGTDFSLLTNLLPHRTRRELKNKFRREERRNRPLIDKALANRQKYDRAPFEKMSAEEEKEKNDVKKRLKKENIAEKHEKTPKRKRGRKKKNSESEEEEDDWGPEYDEGDEENQEDGNMEEPKKAPVIKQAKRSAGVKKEVDYPNKYQPMDKAVPVQIEEKVSVPFVPGVTNSSAPTQQPVPQYEKYLDLDQPQMRNRPTKTYSRFGAENQANQMQSPANGAAVNTGVSSSGIGFGLQTIPGSTQVQIEMEGVQNPVQGVLIPSHMVPQIAPQLGIQGNSAGMQVLLVQEESDSGSLVHVYVIPEGDMGQGPDRPTSHPALSSPIPSPHPATPIQSPCSSFSPAYNPFPAAAPARSPYPTNPIQSPPPLGAPVPHGGYVHKPHPQTFSSAPVQNIHAQMLVEQHQSQSPALPSTMHDSNPTTISNRFGTSAMPNTHQLPVGGPSDMISQTPAGSSNIHRPTGNSVMSYPHLTHTPQNQSVKPRVPTQQTQSTYTNSPGVTRSQVPNSACVPHQFFSTPQTLPGADNVQTFITVSDSVPTRATGQNSTYIPTQQGTAVEGGDVVGTEGDYGDDCVITNSSSPHSQHDRSAMSGISSHL